MIGVRNETLKLKEEMVSMENGIIEKLGALQR
jgi:hypothetical protein